MLIQEFIFTICLNSFFCLGLYYAIRPVGREELKVKYKNWRGKSILEENETGEINLDEIPIFKKPLDWLWYLLNKTYSFPFVSSKYRRKEESVSKSILDEETALELLKTTIVNLTAATERNGVEIQSYSKKISEKTKAILNLKSEKDKWSKLKEEWKQRKWRFHRYLRDLITDCPQCFSSFYGFIFLKFILPKISEPLLGFAFSFPISWTTMGLFAAYVMVLSFINLFIFHIYKVLVGLTELLKSKC